MNCKKKWKVKIYLKNIDDICVQLIEETDVYPMGLNATLGLFINDKHPNIDDFLSDGFEVYLVSVRRNKNA